MLHFHFCAFYHLVAENFVNYFKSFPFNNFYKQISVFLCLIVCSLAPNFIANVITHISLYWYFSCFSLSFCCYQMLFFLFHLTLLLLDYWSPLLFVLPVQFKDRQMAMSLAIDPMCSVHLQLTFLLEWDYPSALCESKRGIQEVLSHREEVQGHCFTMIASSYPKACLVICES